MASISKTVFSQSFKTSHCGKKKTNNSRKSSRIAQRFLSHNHEIHALFYFCFFIFCFLLQCEITNYNINEIKILFQNKKIWMNLNDCEIHIFWIIYYQFDKKMVWYNCDTIVIQLYPYCIAKSWYRTFPFEIIIHWIISK